LEGLVIVAVHYLCTQDGQTMIYVADVKSTQDYKKRRTKMSKMELTKEEEEQLQQDIMTHLDSCPEDLIDELCQVIVDYKMEEDVSKELDIDHNYISECWRREGEKNIIKKYFNARIIEEKAKLSGGYQYTHFLQQELDHLLEEMK
jgi:hypothetical protein